MLEWIESTDLSVAIREGGLPYPIIGGVHLLAIALFGGMLLATDLRLLGWVMRRRSFSDVWYQFRPWKRLGFGIVVATATQLGGAGNAVSQPLLLGKDVAFRPGSSACRGFPC